MYMSNSVVSYDHQAGYASTYVCFNSMMLCNQREHPSVYVRGC